MYDLTGHAMLSDKAAAMQTDEAPKFAEYQRLAESLLGVAGSSLSGDAGDQVKLAVAMQVNYELALGMAPFFEQSSSDKGTKQEAVSYRQDLSSVHPQAREIVASVMLDNPRAFGSNRGFRTLHSVRTPFSR